MAITSLVFTCVIYLCILLSVQVHSFKCPCSSMNGCTRQKPPADIEKEVFVVSNGTSDFKKWNWDSITAVLVDESYTEGNIMCYTHSMNRRYGFIAKITHADHFDKNDDITEKRIKDIAALSQIKVVDIVAVDLMDALTNLVEEEVKEFGNVLLKLKRALIPRLHKVMPVEMVCVVPWKPQCYGNHCSFTDQYIYHACDVIMIDPSSFTVFEDADTCKARASVPFTRLALGIDEYATQGVPAKRIILGVPWHGYSYACSRYAYHGNPATSECFLEKSVDRINYKTFCDYMKARTKRTIGEMRKDHTGEITKSVWSSVYQAPVYNYYSNKTRLYHQVWFENIMSLRLKYQYAHEFALKGIAIFYAEDLSEDQSQDTKGFNGAMWNWVLHGILKTSVTQAPQAPPVKHHADVVAGASIGCLMLGVLLGVLFTCLALRRRVTKPREPPFKRVFSTKEDVMIPWSKLKA